MLSGNHITLSYSKLDPLNACFFCRIGLVSVGSESEKRMTHDSDNRDRRRDNRVRVDRDHRSERERGSDRDSYRSDRYSKYDRDRDRDRDRRGDRDRNHDKRDRDDRRRRDRSPGRRNRSRSPYRRDRDRDCTPERYLFLLPMMHLLNIRKSSVLNYLYHIFQ